MSQPNLNTFFGGKPPPEKKTRLTDEEKKRHAIEYEQNHRKRKFFETWKVNRPWLTFDPISATMKCDICIQAHLLKDNPFVKGCATLKINAIQRHEISKDHNKSVEKVSAAKTLPGESPAEKALNSLTKAQNQRLTFLIQNAHAIAKKARPFTDFQYLSELDIAKGLDIGAQYLNRSKCKEFVTSISNVERQKIRDDFKDKAKAFSLMSDGSTDASTVEEEILYVRYAHKGQITVTFLGIRDVPKADAKNIYSAISLILEKVLGLSPEEWKCLLTGVASDGAAVMMGSENGVVRLLTEGKTDVITVHCLGHRLELAFKDGVKNIKPYADLSSLLIMIFTFYRRSPLNKSKLNTVFKEMGKKPVFPKRIGGTRWIPHLLDALTNFFKGYSAITRQLEQMADPGMFQIEALLLQQLNIN